MKKLENKIHIYELDCYKNATEEQKKRMRVRKDRYFDLEGLPSEEVRKLLEDFVWERGKRLAPSSLASEILYFNNIRNFLIEKNIKILRYEDENKIILQLKSWMMEKGYALTSKKYRSVYEIVATETFQSKDTDFQAALTKIKDKDFDAIVLPGYYTETGKIVNQARGMGIKQPIIGGDGFSDAKFVEQATPAAATDIYYVAGFSTEGEMTDKAKKFVEAYKAKYNEEPSMFAALAYDSVYMVAEASKGAKNSVELKDNLAKLKDLEGVTGTMSVDKNHNPVKSALMIGLKDGKVKSVESVKP